MSTYIKKEADLMRFETRAIRDGQEPDELTGAVTVPVYQTSTFKQEAIGKHKGYEYSRTGNPTRKALEEAVASLEGGKYGLAFASGMAATSAVAGLLKTGDHIIAGDDLYGGTYRLFEKALRPLGIETSYVDLDDLGSLASAIRQNTGLIWVETPTNPLLKVVDLKNVAHIASKHTITLAVDNTFASPYFQRPLEHGADIVVHSTTKYLGGHSDTIGGAIVTSSKDLFKTLKFQQNAAGAVPGPWDCWLVLRGIKTLAVRMKEHQMNAMAVAAYLSEHPMIENVYYPGLADNKYNELAKKQMDGFGGMLSFEIKGGFPAVERFVSRLKIFTLAESLGGVESLVCYPPKMTHGSIPAEQRKRLGINDNLIRLSVGIENIDDLIEDLARSL